MTFICVLISLNILVEIFFTHSDSRKVITKVQGGYYEKEIDLAFKYFEKRSWRESKKPE